MKERQRIISDIKQRILDEQRKHSSLDWADIAARKIYWTWFVDNRKKVASNKKSDTEIFKKLISIINEEINLVGKMSIRGLTLIDVIETIEKLKNR